jgi:hypothetical protein
MKLLRFLSALPLIIISFSLNAQTEEQIPNSGFENWTDAHTATGWNSYELDVIYASYYTASQTADAALGQYAAELKTQNILTESLPGIILLGDINLETYTPSGGIPFASRPAAFSFSYKYAPVGDDSGLAIALLTKWNETEQVSDTVGAGIFMITEAQTEYTRVDVPIYYQSDETPDTINIGFISSAEAPQAGTVLIVDETEMRYDLLNYPTICFPADNISIQNFTAQWAPVAYAQAYRLEIAHDEAFTDMLANYPLELAHSYDASHGVSISEIGQYFYRVKVLYETAESDYSNIINVPIPTVALDASGIGSDAFIANWQTVADADDFLLTVATDAEFANTLTEYTDRSVGTGGSYSVSGLNAETDYFYRLKAVYGNAISKASNTVTVRTQVLSTEELNASDFDIYLSGDVLRIEDKSNQLPARLRIYDLSGRLIMQKQVRETGAEIRLPITGVFIIELRASDKLFSKKVIIRK